MSIFSQVKGLRPKKNAFNLSHQVAQTQNIGQIMPCYLHDGILPNSRERMDAVSVVRMQALLAPLQHKVDLYAHFWYVPYRIIDDKFPKFISGEMERKGETYDCPAITTKQVAMCLHLVNEELINHGGTLDYIDMQTAYLYLFSGNSFLNYLNYPSISPEGIMSETYYSEDYNNDNGRPMNVKRLQAYFYVLAQNYINENFTWVIKDEVSGDIDLTAEMFNFALGDFKVSDYWSIAWSSTYGGSPIEFNPVALSLALICQVLITLSPVSKNMGLPHSWKKDYFTSALPFVQVGTEVSIPLGNSIDFKGGSEGKINLHSPLATFDNGKQGILISGGDTEVSAGHHHVEVAAEILGTGVSEEAQLEDISSNFADIEGSFEADMGAITINELRAANALQRLKESYARFGTRFQEWLKGFWNQNSSDRSMNLPEWLGGMKVPVQISEIEQTSSSTDSAVTGEETPLGTLAGKGLGIGGRKIYDRHFEEPGVIVGLCFIVPKAVYPSCGLDRFLLKTNNIYDYMTPQMEHLGEQEVYSQELYYDEVNYPGLTTFGYQSRYAEYKFMQSRFRGQFSDTLDFWHLGRKFKDLPVLGQEFVTIDEKEMRRPFAVDEVEGESLTNAMIWFN